MSSLQKFHRRTASFGPPALFSTVGSGSDTIGYRLGYASGSSAYLIAAPKSTEVQRVWGSYGTVRGTTSNTDGVANTTTLFGFGSAAHPPAYYCRSLTTGGYNTWYLPAKDELNALYSKKSAVPFATANSFVESTLTYYWSSTEKNNYGAWLHCMFNGVQSGDNNKNTSYYVRAVRQYNAPAAIGDGSATTGYWLGTAGDGVSKLIAAPKSTEVSLVWGSWGITRSTNSLTDGLANTNTLAAFGNSITTGHPAAYAAKNLTTGGYNTWYLPAKNELNTMYSNKSATPFATADSFVGSYYWSSTEYNSNEIWFQGMSTGYQGFSSKTGSKYARAIRRSTI